MLEFKIHKALVLSVRPLGEHSFILSLFTEENGRHLGVVKYKRPPGTGSFVNGRWQARLAEQMGHYYLEDIMVFAAGFLEDKQRLACLGCICVLLDKLLPERQNNTLLYEQTFSFLNQLESPDFIENYIRWEVNLLAALGFGLHLSGCAGGGNPEDLYYVSPNTGRAVSREKGYPYHDKLLRLPAFLWKEAKTTPEELKQGLILTGFFLQTHAGLLQLPLLRERLFTNIK